jgi:hypothetical protein
MLHKVRITFFLLFVFCLVPPVPVAMAKQANDAAVAETQGIETRGETIKEEITIPKWRERFQFQGGFRYRNEMIDEKGKDFRYYHRIRAQIGVVANVWKDIDVGVFLGSGSSDNPSSTNQTLTDSFSTKPVWIDRAYAQWKPSFANGLHLIAGKTKNSFYAVGKSELMWDPDLRPEGIALGYKRAIGPVEPFIIGAAYWIEERKSDDNSWLLGVQGGLKASFLSARLYFLVGAGYYNFTNMKGKALFFDREDSQGNSAYEVVLDDNDTPADPEDDEVQLRYAEDFDQVETLVEVGGKIGRFPWAVFGTFEINIASESDNLAWLAGISFGKCRNPLDFKFRYIYRELEKDSVVGLFSDSDFIGGGTDGRGHEVNFGFQIVKNVQFAITYFYNQTTMYSLDTYQRGQIDFKLKF